MDHWLDKQKENVQNVYIIIIIQISYTWCSESQCVGLGVDVRLNEAQSPLLLLVEHRAAISHHHPLPVIEKPSLPHRPRGDDLHCSTALDRVQGKLVYPPLPSA